MIPTNSPFRRGRGYPYNLYAIAGLAVAFLVTWTLHGNKHSRPLRLTLDVDPSKLAADGFSSAEVKARGPAGERPKIVVGVVQGDRFIRVENARVFATVMPGGATVEVRAPEYLPARIPIVTYPIYSDRARDGMPDFMRLDDVGDRTAFLARFTYIAEAQYFKQSTGLLAEISDCAALIRYTYRECFRDSPDTPVDVVASPPRKYAYPYTPLGPRIFRIKPGAFSEADLNDAFAEFADARTLMSRNAHFISRDIRRARGGDLLFYKQLDQRMPFHAMIFLGQSQIEPGSGERVVYHTGPIGKHPGEIRRPSVAELLSHPSPQWRPVTGNNNFLGVYRWNILREES